jgi:hypothetical protein
MMCYCYCRGREVVNSRRRGVSIELWDGIVERLLFANCSCPHGYLQFRSKTRIEATRFRNPSRGRPVFVVPLQRSLPPFVCLIGGVLFGKHTLDMDGYLGEKYSRHSAVDVGNVANAAICPRCINKNSSTSNFIIFNPSFIAPGAGTVGNIHKHNLPNFSEIKQHAKYNMLIPR